MPVASGEPAHGIPVLDLARFDGQPGDFTRDLGRALREFGFVGFVNHGLDPASIQAACRAYRAFFSLPPAVKNGYRLAGAGGARGYTGFAVEQAREHSVPDLKEFWQVGRELDSANNPLPDILLPNPWPAEVEGFRAASLALYQELDALGRRILSAIAGHLGLPADWFENTVDNGNSILRAIHYPPLDNPRPGAVRAARHEDINVITLLIGSDEDGLEILNRRGNWIPVTTRPDTIVVNIGDMLQRLTNHVLPSTTHRVINPPGDAARRSRYSIPFFLHFNPDFRIRSLPACVDADNPDRYPQAITAHEFLLQRLREIKLL